jgi:hypothetical protein
MPNLTSKELMQLEDQLNGEVLLVTKFKNYANQCTDPELKSVLQQIAQKHQNHYATLMRHLQ